MADYARIFFQRGWADVAGMRPGTGSIDGAYLPFLIEELIAHSAIEFVVPLGSIPATFVDSLPSAFRPYVRLVDLMPARKRCFAVLGHVAEELGMHLEDENRVVRGSLDGALLDQAITVFDGVEIFLIGLEHRAAVDLDLPRFKEATGDLRRQLRQPDGREVLARLEGILATYQALEAPSLRASSTASPDQAKAFLQLLEDREYQDLSRTTLELGFPARSKRAAQIMRRKIGGILSRKPFKQAFNLGAQTITATTQIPVPDSDATQALLSSEYLPPMLKIDRAMVDAAKRWLEAKPDFIPYPGFPIRDPHK